MSEQRARQLGDVIAENVRRVRLERGWTQADLAEPMARRAGWTASTVAWVENGRRKVMADELLWLCDALSVPIEQLLDGTGQVLRHDGRSSMALGMLRGRVLDVAPFGPSHRPTPQRATDRDPTARDDDRKAAARLGMTPGDFRTLVASTYRRTFAAERDRRVGDVAGLSPRVVQAKKGHATRAIIQELQDVLEEPS